MGYRCDHALSSPEWLFARSLRFQVVLCSGRRVNPSELDQLFIVGLRQVHKQLLRGGRDVRRAAYTLFATVELLTEKGILSDELLQPILKRTYEQLSASALGRGVGFLATPIEGSKYEPGRAVPVDCEARLSLCGAACCWLRPALTPEDVDEGVARWDGGEPYRLRAGLSGACGHLRKGGGCGIHAERPLACRTYTCAIDARIWVDFERRIPNRVGIERLKALQPAPPAAERVQMVRVIRERKP